MSRLHRRRPPPADHGGGPSPQGQWGHADSKKFQCTRKLVATSFSLVAKIKAHFSFFAVKIRSAVHHAPSARAPSPKHKFGGPNRWSVPPAPKNKNGLFPDAGPPDFFMFFCVLPVHIFLQKCTLHIVCHVALEGCPGVPDMVTLCDSKIEPGPSKRCFFAK